MRFALLAINFFLVLTLANALMYRKSVRYFQHQDYAAIQLPHRLELQYERSFAIWREIGAATLTIFVFGGIAYLPALNQYRRSRLTSL